MLLLAISMHLVWMIRWMAVLLQMDLEIVLLYNHLAERRKGFRLLLLDLWMRSSLGVSQIRSTPSQWFFPGSSSPIGRRLRTASPCAAALFPPGSLGGMEGMPNSSAGWPDIRAAGRKGGGTFGGDQLGRDLGFLFLSMLICWWIVWVWVMFIFSLMEENLYVSC